MCANPNSEKLPVKLSSKPRKRKKKKEEKRKKKKEEERDEEIWIFVFLIGDVGFSLMKKTGFDVWVCDFL